ELRGRLLGAFPDGEPEGGVDGLGDPDQGPVGVLRILLGGRLGVRGRRRDGDEQHGRTQQRGEASQRSVPNHSGSSLTVCGAAWVIEEWTARAYLRLPLRTWSAKTAMMMMTPMATCCQNAEMFRMFRPLRRM